MQCLRKFLEWLSIAHGENVLASRLLPVNV